MTDKAWHDFAEWVAASVELEAKMVVQALKEGNFDYRRGRRDALEDVWAMILAFQSEREES